jgi:phosphate transport system permease protein
VTRAPATPPGTPGTPGISAAEPIGRLGRARSKTAQRLREGLIELGLSGCAVFSILTTFAIIVVLTGETIRFFALEEVSIVEFLTGTEWNPLLGAERHFGIWPLACGTLLVTAIAMLVALPLGYLTAIFLSEYAPRPVRAVLKPVLEILAGIPTVVYGFFALTVITPALQHLHGGFDVYNATSAGIAVGIMCLPIVCSMTEDSLQAVPQSLREGAYALGGTKFDTSIKVVFPAALSGVIAASLLSVARAVGETMIVALAAGNLARLTVDPREQSQTMTAYMVQIFLGDASNFGPEYFSSYAVATTLFLMTLTLTIVGHYIRVRFREAYE